MGDLGNRLYEEMKSSVVEVVYGIDQNKENVFSEIPIYSSEDELPAADAIIVTPYLSYAQIIQKIKQKFQGNIISLEDIIYSIY
jgi:delta-aminolevulinic acid dehydratase/porphobilinogen synthase